VAGLHDCCAGWPTRAVLSGPGVRGDHAAGSRAAGAVSVGDLHSHSDRYLHPIRESDCLPTTLPIDLTHAPGTHADYRPHPAGHSDKAVFTADANSSDERRTPSLARG